TNTNPHVERLITDGGLLIDAQTELRSPLHAHHRKVTADRIERAFAAAGLQSDDDFEAAGIPILLTVAEVAKIYGVSEKFVYRHAGTDLPAPLKVGGVLRFKSTAVIAMLARAA